MKIMKIMKNKLNFLKIISINHYKEKYYLEKIKIRF